MINGIFNIRKEAGYTSFDAVAKLKRITGTKKMGHTGTLDPGAEGVLVVCAGNATGIVSLLENDRKTYEAVMRLGVRTDTLDMSGEVTDTAEINLSEEEVIKAVKSFTGEITQIPPMYSAVKINGKRLYELARKGETVERKSRKVHIYSTEILDISLPLVKFRTECSKGTYIRTLCDDIGEKLGCYGAMESLLRTGCGRFRIEDAHTLGEIACSEDFSEYAMSVEDFFGDLPEIRVTPEKDVLVLNGNKINCSENDADGIIPASGMIRMYTSDGIFRAVYRYNEGVMEPVKMFL